MPMNPGHTNGARRAASTAAAIAAGTAAYCPLAADASPVRFDAPPDFDLSSIEITKPAEDQHRSHIPFTSPAMVFSGESSAGAALYDYTYSTFMGFGVELISKPLDLRIPSWTSTVRSGAVGFQGGDLIGGTTDGDWSQEGVVSEGLTTWRAGNPDFYAYYDYQNYHISNLQDEDPNIYLGARFTLDGATHYGWIGINLLYEGGAYFSIFAWGYETEAGVAISAGVPGPASLGVLAVGAAGVLKRRKREV